MTWARGGAPPCDFYRRIEEGMAEERGERICQALADIFARRERARPLAAPIIDRDPGDEQ